MHADHTGKECAARLPAAALQRQGGAVSVYRSGFTAVSAKPCIPGKAKAGRALYLPGHGGE